MDAPFSNGTPQQFRLAVTLRTGRFAANSTPVAADRNAYTDIRENNCWQLVRQFFDSGVSLVRE